MSKCITIFLVLHFSAYSQQSSTDNSTMEYHETIQTYYRSYKEAGRVTLRRLLTDDFCHISEFSTFNGPNEMLDTIWPEVGKSRAKDLQFFGEHPEYLVRSTEVGGDHPTQKIAECIRFERDMIAEIEVFYRRGIKSLII